MERAPEDKIQSEAPEDRPSAIVRWGYPLFAALLVALYARTVAMGPTFSDGPEIVTAIVNLGVIHPTGYPLFTLVAHAFVKILPLDVQPCIKVSLFNALCGAAAALFTAHSARLVALLVHPGPSGAKRGRIGADLTGLFAGLLLGTCPLVWDYVRIPEVYVFHLFLASWALYSIVRFEVTRRAWLLVMGGLAIGLGLAHHVTMVYMLPAGIIYTLTREPSIVYSPFTWPLVKLVRLFKKGFWAGASKHRPWVFPAVLFVGVAPVTFYLYLLWANKHTAAVNWAGIKDWDGLYFHMTGKQYARFMEWKGIGQYIARLGKLGEAFDKQFLTVGTVLILPGLFVTFRRAWRMGVFLVLVFVLFVFHGVYYSVGDYQTYWLPAFMAAAILLSVGLDGLVRWARDRTAETRLLYTLITASVVFSLASVSVVVYSLLPRRLPGDLARVAPWAFGLPLALVACAACVLAFLVRKRQLRGEAPWLVPSKRLFPWFLLGSAIAPSLPAVLVRVNDIDARQVIGDSYGREIMENAPPGSVIMVQGDGYLFTLWYQTFVMNRGTDSAVIDVGTLGAKWYKEHLISRYPAECDPLAPEFRNDRAAYEAKCKTFRQRVDLEAKQGWITLGDRRVKRLTSLERQRGVAILREALAKSSGRSPVLPHADVRCDSAKFRKEHNKECKCWFDPARSPYYTDDCVFSADEEGIVPRERVEIWLHHLVDEHIEERPIFERNLFTHWVGNARDNARSWSGPHYQRISGDYALLNRGRANQILFAADVSGKAADACAPVRSMVNLQFPRGKQPKEGRPYRPNEWPMLITATFLTRVPEEGDDYARRLFHPGDQVRLWIDWFEKYRYDYFADDKRGTPIKHGIRLCIFDGEGNRAGMKTTLSGGRRDAATFKLPKDAPLGDYHVAVCTVGDVGNDPKLSEDLPCQRLILEYGFQVEKK